MDDTRAVFRIGLNPGVVPLPTAAVLLQGNGTRYWAHLLWHLPRLRVWGITSPLKLEEPYWKRG